MPQSIVAPYFISIAVIFVTLLVLFVASRRLKGVSFARGRLIQSPIQIVSARSIGGQNSLAIAEVEGRRFLIGVGRNGVTKIGDLTEASKIDIEE